MIQVLRHGASIVPVPKTQPQNEITSAYALMARPRTDNTSCFKKSSKNVAELYTFQKHLLERPGVSSHNIVISER